MNLRLHRLPNVEKSCVTVSERHQLAKDYSGEMSKVHVCCVFLSTINLPSIASHVEKLSSNYVHVRRHGRVEMGSSQLARLFENRTSALPNRSPGALVAWVSIGSRRSSPYNFRHRDDLEKVLLFPSNEIRRHNQYRIRAYARIYPFRHSPCSRFVKEPSPAYDNLPACSLAVPYRVILLGCSKRTSSLTFIHVSPLDSSSKPMTCSCI